MPEFEYIRHRIQICPQFKYNFPIIFSKRNNTQIMESIDRIRNTTYLLRDSVAVNET